jgi:hypothetical protein
MNTTSQPTMHPADGVSCGCGCGSPQAPLRHVWLGVAPDAGRASVLLAGVP